MPKAYSEDLRTRVLMFMEAGGRPAEAVQRFAVSRGSLYVWRQQAKAGQKAARVQGRKRGVSRVDGDALRAYIKAYPDKTLHEVGQHFAVSGVMIWKRLRQLGYSFKKRLSYTESAVKKSARPLKR